MSLYLANLNPQNGEQNVVVDSTVQLSVLDTAYSVVQSTIQIWIDESLAYSNSEFQDGFSGTVSPSGSGYVFDITVEDDHRYEAVIGVAVEAENNNSESARLVYSFETTLNLYYNVYYALTENSPWRLSNSSPLLHDIEGNEYTITGLQAGVQYYVSIVPGRMEEGEFVPLMTQSLPYAPRGAVDISGAKSYPRYIIKTFSP